MSSGGSPPSPEDGIGVETEQIPPQGFSAQTGDTRYPEFLCDMTITGACLVCAQISASSELCVCTRPKAVEDSKSKFSLEGALGWIILSVGLRGP